MTDVEIQLYKAFQCQPSMLGWGGDPQAEGKRAKIDRIHQYYLKHAKYTDKPALIVSQVRKEWTAGLGPVASWLMWQAMKYLIKTVVMWLWNYYHVQGLAGNSQK